MGLGSIWRKRFPTFVNAVILTEMWETFSYYSLFWILTIYLSDILGFPSVHVYAIPALHNFLSNLLPIFYGLLADRFFGFRIMVLHAILMLFFGHLVMTISAFNDYALFVGIAFLTIGYGLFKGNNPNLLGTCYDRHPEYPRVAGFTMFYTGINFAGFISAITSAYAMWEVGFHFAFSLGAFGMVFAVGIFFYYNKLFNPMDYIRNRALLNMKFAGGLLTWQRLLFVCHLLLVIPFTFVFAYAGVISRINFLAYFAVAIAILCLFVFYKLKTSRDRRNFGLLIIYFTYYMFFSSFANQVLTTFALFLARNTYNFIFGIEIPPLLVNVTNPLFITITGFMLSFFREPSFKEEYIRVFLALISTSGAFSFFYFGAVYANPESGLTSLAWPFVGTLVISAGEVLIGPLIKGICVKYSPSDMKGVMMGIHQAVLGLASLAGIIFGGIFDIPLREDNTVDPLVSIEIYKKGFIDIVIYNLIACAIFLALFPLMWYLQRPTKDELEVRAKSKERNFENMTTNIEA